MPDFLQRIHPLALMCWRFISGKVVNTIEFNPEIRGTAFTPHPSCHIGPVSGGRSHCPSPRRRRPQRAAPRPPPSEPLQPPGVAARCLGLEDAAGEATGRAKSHELLRRISEDFGSEKLGVWQWGHTSRRVVYRTHVSIGRIHLL